jgi:hypothetical protein
MTKELWPICNQDRHHPGMNEVKFLGECPTLFNFVTSKVTFGGTLKAEAVLLLGHRKSLQ